MEISLKGKVAWVTGASGGIGAGIVQSLVSAGATVLSSDLTDGPAVETEGVVHRQTDVTRQEDIDAAVKFCATELGGLDILVNNAGIQRRADIFDVTRDLWQRVLDVNLTAYFFCAQAAARAMVSHGRGGSIINMVSINSDHVYPNTIPYCTSKGGVRTLTFALAVALGGSGIRVNGIAPGTISTNINADRWETPGAREGVEARTPLGRLGTPADIGPSVAYLASDHCAFVTGAILPIHGGRVLWA